MKFKKFIIPALCMAMLSAGCSGQDPVTPGNGQNGNGGTNENIENGLQVTASTTVINADGQDAARINVYYDKVKLSLDAVAFYDAKSNDVLDLSKFTIEDNTLVYTVTEPGEFSFWVAYKTHNTKDRPTTISAVEFSVPDAVVSNFHLPESTMLMAVAAFGGFDHVLNAYQVALDEGYRFGPYGDAMLVV